MGDEVVDVHMELEDMPMSSESTLPADSFSSHGTDSMPCATTDDEEVSVDSMSNEDSEQLDFYLFNLTAPPAPSKSADSVSK